MPGASLQGRQQVEPRRLGRSCAAASQGAATAVKAAQSLPSERAPGFGSAAMRQAVQALLPLRNTAQKESGHCMQGHQRLQRGEEGRSSGFHRSHDFLQIRLLTLKGLQNQACRLVRCKPAGRKSSRADRLRFSGVAGNSPATPNTLDEGCMGRLSSKAIPFLSLGPGLCDELAFRCFAPRPTPSWKHVSWRVAARGSCGAVRW